MKSTCNACPTDCLGELQPTVARSIKKQRTRQQLTREHDKQMHGHLYFWGQQAQANRRRLRSPTPVSQPPREVLTGKSSQAVVLSRPVRSSFSSLSKP